MLASNKRAHVALLASLRRMKFLAGEETGKIVMLERTFGILAES